MEQRMSDAPKRAYQNQIAVWQPDIRQKSTRIYLTDRCTWDLPEAQDTGIV